MPGLLHTITEDYFRRIEAVEFAVKNDDGAEPRNLPKADLVLVGISRTSKTPLSTYLAQRGLKVANVPLVLGVDPPEELSQVDDRKVFGLIVQPDMLMRIRQARLSHLGMPHDSSYGQRAHIDNEIAYCARDLPQARELAGHRRHEPRDRGDRRRHPAHLHRAQQRARYGVDLIGSGGMYLPGAPCQLELVDAANQIVRVPGERLAVPRRGDAGRQRDRDAAAAVEPDEQAQPARRRDDIRRDRRDS